MVAPMTRRAPEDPLSRLPPGLFGAALGLSGAALFWSQAAVVDLAPVWLGWAIMMPAALAFTLAAIGHGAKALFRPQAFRQDMADPTRLAAFAAGPMSLMGIGALTATLSPGAGTAIWLTGCAGQVIAAGVFVGRLVRGRLAFNAVGPIWILPLVGAFAATGGGIAMGQDALAAAMFGLGLLGFLVALPLIIVRLAFHERPPEGPPLVILLTPSALGAVAVIALDGGVDHAALAVWGSGWLVLAALAALAPRLWRGPSLNVWNAVFPTANYAIATLHVGEAMELPVVTAFGLALGVIASGIACYGLGWTIWTAATRGLTATGAPFRPDPSG